jgi:hypothetical protein
VTKLAASSLSAATSDGRSERDGLRLAVAGGVRADVLVVLDEDPSGAGTAIPDPEAAVNLESAAVGRGGGVGRRGALPRGSPGGTGGGVGRWALPLAIDVADDEGFESMTMEGSWPVGRFGGTDFARPAAGV